MKEKIIEQIKEIEQKEGVEILFASESGSRAWGFPSPDSDYDVRFIYKHPKEWYLSLQEPRDVIEVPVDAILDVSGWDVRKTLRLAGKHNPVIYEWLQSPIIYQQNEKQRETLTEAVRSAFSPLPTLHHYLSAAKKHLQDCLEDELKLKRYFYCLRCTLSAAWVVENQNIPPMEISKLLPIMKDQKLMDRVLTLIELKATQDEAYMHKREPELQEYLVQTIAKCEELAPSITSKKTDYALLDSYFRKMIQDEP